MRLFEFSNRLLGFNPEINFTSSYIKNYTDPNILDLRSQFKPSKKVPVNEFGIPKYPQVFEDRLGFLPGLSVIDLLFCEGPGAAGILIK